jgi:hypothetical protein
VYLICFSISHYQLSGFTSIPILLLLPSLAIMRSTYFLAAVPLALAAPTQLPEPISVAIPPRGLLTTPTGALDPALFFNNLNKTLSKYHSTQLLPTLELSPLHILPRNAARATIGAETLTDQISSGEDILYYGSVTIGTSRPQTFTFDFDTGSADIFVPGPSCGSAQGCVHPTKYNQAGTPQHRTTNVTYGSGKITGADYVDSVTVAGRTATNQGIISLTQAAGFGSSQADGLMGMAFSNIASSGFVTFFENLIKQRKVPVPEFGFYLGRAKSFTQGKSEMFLGGRNPAKYTGSFTTIAVSRQGYWQIPIDGVAVSNINLAGATKGQAAIDTGTTLVIAPKSAAQAIFAKIPGAYPLQMNSGTTLYAYPCNTAAQYIPSLVFAGRPFQINPLDFNFGQISSNFVSLVARNPDAAAQSLVKRAGPTCVAGIVGADLFGPGQNLWVVGDTWLKNWYSVYSYTGAGGKPSVSFARAI